MIFGSPSSRYPPVALIGDASLRRPHLLDPTSCYSLSRLNDSRVRILTTCLVRTSVVLRHGVTSAPQFSTAFAASASEIVRQRRGSHRRRPAGARLRPGGLLISPRASPGTIERCFSAPLDGRDLATAPVFSIRARARVSRGRSIGHNFAGSLRRWGRQSRSPTMADGATFPPAPRLFN